MATGESPGTSGIRSPHREHPPVPEFETLASTLQDRLDGEVQFDEYNQVLYATDGSIYQARPAGVVHPFDRADVVAAVEVATEHDVPVLPRGAGSSLAGQAVGPGCLVLDFSTHMDDLLAIDPGNRTATVQPGVVQDDLDAALERHGLKFPPDPASSNRATIGGGIGNNSTGAHSVRYGITDAYTEKLGVVLANGEYIRTREVVLDSPEYEDIVSADSREAEIYRTVRRLVEANAAEIQSRYPELKRSVSGYNLQKVISENAAGERVIDLSALFVGAEGTLGIVVEATVSLVTRPEETALALYCFDSLDAALRAVPVALEYPVSAVELMDKEVFRLARESEGYARFAEPVPDGTAAALLLEWDDELVGPAATSGEGDAPTAGGRESESPAQPAERTRYPGATDQREAFEAAIAETTARFVAEGDAFEVVEAHESTAVDRLWKLRKAAIPLLMSLEGDAKPYPFIEDATVPPAELATYVAGFQEILDDHDTSAAFFAHAGSGTLHIRPILSLKDDQGVETMREIADDVTDLVLDHHGAFSGEHGDGMARTEFSPKMYGEDLWRAFKECKTAFDPEWLLHPGNVVYRDGPDDSGPDSDRGVGADMREHLRYGPGYQTVEPATALDFEEEGGFAHLVELCNGCGTCRQTGSDVMCPTYRASKEEIQTTRGRANLLRAAISGELDESELYSERFQRSVLDLCIGCKGCKSDCPTGVDLAKLKAELKQEYRNRSGSTRRDRLFRDFDSYAALGSRLAPLSNLATRVPGSDWLAHRLFGIAPERDLPTFASESFEQWYADRGGAGIDAATATDRVVLFPDTFTNYIDPRPGKAAITVLEAADVHVCVPDGLAPSGRAAFSLGFLEDARDRARQNVETLAPLVDDGWSVLFVEPSDATMFQDEYRDLFGGRDDSCDPPPEVVSTVADAAASVFAYLDRERVTERVDFDPPAKTLTYHGHCNQKALGTDHHAVGVLRRAGYAVEPVDSTCCGMAGSFGYETEHYDLSQAIGRLLFDKVEASPGDVVTAPGGSCRSQLGSRDGAMDPPHPVEKLAAALRTVQK